MADIVTLIQQYLSTTDPAQGQSLRDQLVQQFGAMGLPLTDATMTFIQDEADMEHSSGRGAFVTGWHLGPHDSVNDFFQLASMAETFAANTGYAHMPTAQQLQWGLEHGMASADQEQVFQWMSTLAGVNDSMPWAATGLSHTDYDKQSESLADTYRQYTGDEAPSDVLHTAITQRWSSQRLQQFLQSDPNTLAKYGWVGYGYDYSSFQTFKRTNQGQASTRFGGTPTDANFLQLLRDPLTPIAAAGQPVGQASQPPSSQQSQSAATGVGRQSQVR